MTGRHLSPRKARPCADAVPPFHEAIVPVAELVGLRHQAKQGEHRGCVKVGQAEGRASEPRRLADHIWKRREADSRRRQGGRNHRVVGGCAVRRPRDALDIDIPNQRSIGVAVENADHLRHPGAIADIVGLQLRPGDGLVDVSSDRFGFVEAKARMLKGWDLAERVPGHMVGGGTPCSEDVDRNQVVGDTLFLQRTSHGADVNAVRCTKDNGLIVEAHGPNL